MSMPSADERPFVYMSTKTYTHSVGLSCCFRQWRAESHCHFLHGYALEVNFVFGTTELDHRNWVVDFGGLKSLKGWLEDTFDHKTLVASDDPQINMFRDMHDFKIIDMIEVPACGCEKFAEFIFEFTEQWLKDAGFAPRCKLVQVEVREHAGNGAIVVRS